MDWIHESAGCFELWGQEVILCRRGSDLSGWLIPFLCQAYAGWYSHTSAYAEVCNEARGCCMDGLLLDHFQWLVGILYSNVPAVQEGMELLKAEEH